MCVSSHPFISAAVVMQSWAQLLYCQALAHHLRHGCCILARCSLYSSCKEAAQGTPLAVKHAMKSRLAHSNACRPAD